MGSVMKLIKNGDLEIYQAEHIGKAGIRHGYTTRLGGVSTGDYDSMTLSFNKTDTVDNAIRNFEILLEALDLDINRAVLTHQTHTNTIKVIDESHLGYGFPGNKGFEDVDGLITNIKGIPIFSFYADCTPIIFYDPVQGVVGTAHAGWRGTLKDIGKEMIRLFGDEFNSRAKDILVGIGPSIEQCCFEVDEDVAILFYDLPDNYHKFIEKRANGKYHIDVKSINTQKLIDCGVKEENIEISDQCTKCSPHRFFSHRAHGLKRGNQGVVIAL